MEKASLRNECCHPPCGFQSHITTDRMLYHATYQARVPSILAQGLMPNCEKAWSISESNVVYLAQNAEGAYCFAETAEEVVDSVYDSGIVVFGVLVDDLDKSRLGADNNVSTGETYIYRGTILPHLLQVIQKDVG